jgi:hypothetical protein
MLDKSKTIKLGTRLAAASDKVYQLIAHGQRFASGTPTTFTTKTWSSWYSWNFAESGIKHNKSTQITITLAFAASPLSKQH